MSKLEIRLGAAYVGKEREGEAYYVYKIDEIDNVYFEIFDLNSGTFLGLRGRRALKNFKHYVTREASEVELLDLDIMGATIQRSKVYRSKLVEALKEAPLDDLIEAALSHVSPDELIATIRRKASVEG